MPEPTTLRCGARFENPPVRSYWKGIERPAVCGLPIEGSGPCATCGQSPTSFIHRPVVHRPMYPWAWTTHPYTPSEWRHIDPEGACEECGKPPSRNGWATHIPLPTLNLAAPDHPYRPPVLENVGHSAVPA